MNKEKIRHLWKDIAEAVRGSQKDFTEVKLGRAILLLSVPMVLEMIMESVFAVVDIFFVSKVGPDAVAAVGITESLLTLVYAVAYGLSIATTATVARRIGEKNPEGASVAAVQAIILGIAVSILVSILGIVFAADLLNLMGASPQVVETGYMYTAIILGSNMLVMMLFIINAVFRSAGDAAISMRVLWFANIINMILDPMLIFGIGPFPELGVMGAAIATSTGRGLAVIYQLTLLFRGRGRVKVTFRQIRVEFDVIWQLVKLSLGGIGQSIISTSSWIGLVRIIAEFGSQPLAGYTIAIRVVIFSLLPSWGLSNAAATLVGQNLGAKKPDRAEKAVWITGFINLAMLGIIAVFFILFSEAIIRLFISDPVVIASGAMSLRILSYGYLFYAMGMVLVQAFNGAGDTATPTMINFVCFWMLEIPLAWLLAKPFGMKEKGVYFAILAAEALLTVLGVVLFRRGKWKSRSI